METEGNEKKMPQNSSFPRNSSAVWSAMKKVKTKLSLTEEGATPVKWKIVFLVFISLVSRKFYFFICRTNTCMHACTHTQSLCLDNTTRFDMLIQKASASSKCIVFTRLKPPMETETVTCKLTYECLFANSYSLTPTRSFESPYNFFL